MRRNEEVTKLVICATMAGIYVVLSMFLTIQVGGFKLTFEHFPVIFCSLVLGPMWGVGVGFVGELLNQLFTYGITLTTALWILPIVFRAFAVGCCAKWFTRWMHTDHIISRPVPIFFCGVCVVSGVISSLLNTLAYYVDSKMNGYYQYAMVFGVLGIRLLSSIIVSIMIVMLIKSLLYALRRARLI